MPKLKPLILEDIAAQFCLKKENITYGWYEEVQRNAEHLVKFMLSGRECFGATLDYFGRSKRVEIQHHTITVYVKPFVGKKENAHAIPYRFKFIQHLLDVIVPSLEDLTIAGCPKDRRGYTVLDQLIHNGLKCVQLYDLLDMDYMQRFKNECSLETLQSICFNNNSHEISNIFAIKASCHYLKVDFMDLCTKMPVATFPDIENLCIDAKLAKKQNQFDFAVAFENISSLITEIFPNLRSLKFLFENDFGSLMPMLTAFRRDCFDDIPSWVKGIVHAKVIDDITHFENAVERLQGEPNIVFDEIHQKVIKEEEIHTGFTLKLEIQCLGLLTLAGFLVQEDGSSSEEEDFPFPHLYG